MRWLRYAVATLAAAVLVGAALMRWVWPAAGAAVWLGVGVAYAIQLVAFGGLLLARRQPERFVVVWGGGTLVRFLVVGGVGLWVTRTEMLPAEPLLLSLVGALLLLLMLEPVFLDRGTSRR